MKGLFYTDLILWYFRTFTVVGNTINKKFYFKENLKELKIFIRFKWIYFSKFKVYECKTMQLNLHSQKKIKILVSKNFKIKF